MTTKTVAVQLIGMTQQYQAAMGKATASTTKLQAASASTGKSIGSVMGPTIAIGAAVAAGAAVKLALDWDNAFTRIAAVTDTSQAQVEQWKTQVMDLAGTTARAPQELADALYFLASAGLDASEVMPTLKASAQAAAVGLGETGDIARLTANAINAYSSSGLTAAEVTDTLVAAVREGTAEPDEFADAMGRILPIASKAGISFDQVAASLAGLSNIGLDVNEGVTAMRGVIQALVAPTKQTTDQLDALGLTAQDVRDSLAEDGLIGTLRMLETATGGNIDKLRKIVPNVRALTGVFGLTQQEAEKVNDIFRDVEDSTGDLGAAMEKTAKSPAHKLRQAIADLKVEGTKIGEDVLPAAADAAGILADAVGALSDGIKMDVRFMQEWLNPAEKSHRLMVQLSEAFLGGTVNGAQFREILGKMSQAGALTAKDFAALDRMVNHTRGGFQQGATEADRYRGDIDHLAGAADGAAPPVEELGGAVGDTAVEFARAQKFADDFGDELDRLAGVALDAASASIDWNQALADMRKELRGGTKSLDVTTQAGRDNAKSFIDASQAAIDHAEALVRDGMAHDRATKLLRDHVGQLRDEAIQAGFSKDAVDALIRKLNLTPKQITTLIKAKTDEAKRAVEAFVRDASGKVITITVKEKIEAHHGRAHSGGVVGKLPTYHSGGRIKSDEQMVLARVGETIRTPAQERALMSSRGSASSSAATQVVVVNKIAPRLDRRRFTDGLDHEATYSGRW